MPTLKKITSKWLAIKDSVDGTAPLQNYTEKAKILMDMLVELGRYHPKKTIHSDMTGLYSLRKSLENNALFGAFLVAWHHEKDKGEEVQVTRDLNESTKRFVDFALKHWIIDNSASEEQKKQVHLMGCSPERADLYDRAVIAAITEYRNPWQQTLYSIGRGLAFFFALACGVTIGYPLLLPVIAGTATSVALSLFKGIFFSAVVTYFNWYITRDFTPRCLIDIFGKRFEKRKGIDRNASVKEKVVAWFSDISASFASGLRYFYKQQSRDSEYQVEFLGSVNTKPSVLATNKYTFYKLAPTASQSSSSSSPNPWMLCLGEKEVKLSDPSPPHFKKVLKILEKMDSVVNPSDALKEKVQLALHDALRGYDAVENNVILGKRTPLSNLKTGLLVFFSLCALAAGISGAGLTFYCVYAGLISPYSAILQSFYFLPLIFAYVGAGLLAIGFAVAFTALLMNGVSKTLSTENIPATIKAYFRKVFQDKNWIQKLFMVVVLAGSFFLGPFGLAAWAMAGTNALTPILGVVGAVLVAGVFSVLGQFPFVMINATKFGVLIADTISAPFSWLWNKISVGVSFIYDKINALVRSKSSHAKLDADNENEIDFSDANEEVASSNGIFPLIPLANAAGNAVGPSLGFMAYVAALGAAIADLLLKVMYAAVFFNSAATVVAADNKPAEFMAREPREERNKKVVEWVTGSRPSFKSVPQSEDQHRENSVNQGLTL